MQTHACTYTYAHTHIDHTQQAHFEIATHTPKKVNKKKVYIIKKIELIIYPSYTVCV